jgi:hypothetical protein
VALDEAADRLALRQQKEDVNAEPVKQVLGELLRIDRDQGIEPAARE